jgi:hypothetical protein
MDFSGPKRLWWWVALIIWVGVIIGVVGILAQLVPIPALAGYAFSLLAIGFVLVALGAGAAFWVLGGRGRGQ